MSIPFTPPENGALISGQIRYSLFGSSGARDYELKRRVDDSGQYYELFIMLDSGTWLCDQERFRSWEDVIGFFYRLRLENVETLYY